MLSCIIAVQMSSYDIRRTTFEAENLNFTMNTAGDLMLLMHFQYYAPGRCPSKMNMNIQSPYFLISQTMIRPFPQALIYRNICKGIIRMQAQEFALSRLAVKPQENFQFRFKAEIILSFDHTWTS